MENKKNILIITHNDFPEYEGLTKRIKGFSNFYQRKGFNTIVAAPVTKKYSNYKSNKLTSNEFKTIHINNPNFVKNLYNSRLILKFLTLVQMCIWILVNIKQIRQKNFEFIQCEQLFSLIPGILLSLITRKKIIFDDFTLVSSNLKNSVNKLTFSVIFIIEFLIIKLSTKIIVTSKITFEYIKRFEKKSKKIIFIPNGSNVEPINLLEKEDSIIFVGSMYYYQNIRAIEFLINKIYPELISIFPDLRLQIIGGPLSLLNSNLLKQLKSNLGSNGKFLGYVSDIEQYYYKTKYTILPFPEDCELTGGSRIKVLESMANGIAVISTKNGIKGIPGIKKGVHYLEFSTIEECVKNLTNLMRNKNLYEQIVKNANLFIKNNYSWDYLIEKEFSKFLN